MFRQATFAIAAAVSFAGAAQAAIPIYGAPGTEAAEVASYTAPFAGNITGWFLYRSAGYNSEVGVSLNGGVISYPGLNNSMAPGTSANLGAVAANDVIRFFLRVNTTGDVFSTQKNQNADNYNHAWHTPYSGGDFVGVPSGLAIGWEDINGGGDQDYNDNVFSFTFPGAPNGGVPEPATWAMLIAGFGLVGMAMRRRTGLARVSA